MQSANSDRLPSLPAPSVWLKEGHSLRGKDVLPVVFRLTQTEEVEIQNSASVSRKYPLPSYSVEDLGLEFKKLTGYDITVSLFLLELFMNLFVWLYMREEFHSHYGVWCRHEYIIAMNVQLADFQRL